MRMTGFIRMFISTYIITVVKMFYIVFSNHGQQHMMYIAIEITRSFVYLFEYTSYEVRKKSRKCMSYMR